MIVTIKDLGRDCPLTEIKGHGWFPARPINYQCRTLRERFREAWMVFAGKADPFVWPENSFDSRKRSGDEWTEEAELSQKKSDVWENEVETLRAELKKADEALESNITTFIDQREQIQEAREIAAAMRRGSIQAEYYKTHPFPWETPASLDSENA